MSGYTMILNRILRPLFYIPFRIFTKCETVPLEPLKTANIDPELTTVYITVSSSLGNLLCIGDAFSVFEVVHMDGIKGLCHLDPI